MTRSLLVGIAFVWWLSGCGRDVGLRCEDQERYSDSAEIAPIRIPDDLDAPDETEALQIPNEPELAEGSGTPTDGPCTESPPEFFEEGLPG